MNFISKQYSNSLQGQSAVNGLHEAQDRKLTIIHCIDSLSRGGSEILLKDTLPLLKDYNNIVCYLHPPDSLISEFKNIPVYCLGYTSKFSFWRVMKNLRTVINKHQASIIHSHLFYSTLFARFARPSQIRLVFTVHNILSKDAFEVNRLSLWTERTMYNKNQIIVGVSREVLNDYDAWVGIKGKSFVLYNYINDKFFNLDYAGNLNASAGLRLIAVGNLRRQKNYLRLLEAFSMLSDLPISLDIYGAGDLEHELAARIKREKLNVRLMGRVDDVSKVLPNYEAYIMPSLFEGFGIAPMEAMAAGMPVLLSDLPVFRELAEDIPYYFDPLNSSSIAEAIKFSFDNWTVMRERGKRGKQLIYNKASRDVYLKKLKEIYTSAIA